MEDLHLRGYRRYGIYPADCMEGEREKGTEGHTSSLLINCGFHLLSGYANHTARSNEQGVPVTLELVQLARIIFLLVAIYYPLC